MPELPEVETIRRGLHERLAGKRIEHVEVGTVPLRRGSPLPLDLLAERTIVGIRRHAKFLFWDLDDGKVLVAHLGMTGKFLFEPPGATPRAHTHLVVNFEDEEVHYSDPRRFGFLRLHRDAASVDDVGHYGPDALDPTVNAAWFARSLASSKAPLKAFLLDQTKLAGVGNIYACEALWRAKLSPRRKACNTPRGKVAPLLGAVVDVLNDSLAQGGTSFNDYVSHIGEPGTFLLDLAVFQKEGQPCPRCATAIRRIVQSGRSTFFCPACQR